ncbi:FG-GAP-like repeat-containing protein [uncultured Tateyamaria sp.]|uniref:FG-GAP-like repeat-containing protein n=1 Tax=Tateyamaria sp. 1078 TaxID=3417464 RepID=UPI002610BE03|nr:FG-GAP-like repeat-containing protein [uncultured Tateyamaria sp.]
MPTFTPDTQGTYEFDLVVSDFEFTSDPVTLSLVVPNRAPTASVTGPETGTLDGEFVFDAAASNDPDGDALAFSFAIVDGPAGNAATLIPGADGTAALSADIGGTYEIRVTVSDGVDTASASAVIEITGANRPPAFVGLVADYAAEVGLPLSVTFEAVDPDGDTVSYFLQPLPLPEGMQIDTSTGVLLYLPEPGAEGVISLTVGASDGVLTTVEPIAITVAPPDAGETSLAGVVLDATDFANGIETPVVGARIALAGAAVDVVTDAAGGFVLQGLTAGDDVLNVTPDNAGGGFDYAVDRRTVRVFDNQAARLPGPVLLSRLGDGCAPVVAGAPTILQSAISGVRVDVPADSVLDTTGAPYTGEICLGSLPQQIAHPGFAEGVEACQIYALDAPGAVFSQPVTVTAPNVDALPTGARATLWQLQNGFARFARIARGDVSADGTEIVAANVDVRDGSSLIAFLPQAPRTRASDSEPTGMRSVTPFLGNNATTYTLPGYMAFGETQQVGLTYNSQSIGRTMIVTGDVTIPADASLPVSLTTTLRVGGLDIADERVWTVREGLDGTVPALVGEAVTASQTVPLDTSGLTSGREGYSFVARAHYACSTVIGSHASEVVIKNDRQSPYGTGWAIDDLQQLVVEEDGSITVLDDDTVTSFDPAQSFTAFDPDPVVIPADFPIFLAVEDFDLDGSPDIAVAESGPGDVTLIQSFGGDEFGRVRSINATDVRRNSDSDPELEADLTSIVAADFDRDGFLDIPYTGQLAKELGVLFGDGTARFIKEVQDDDADARYMVRADLDGDGFEDIIYAESTAITIVGNADIRAYFGGPDGFTEARVYRTTEGGIRSGTLPLELKVGDFDSDGNLDVAVRSRLGIHFAFGEGGRNFTGLTTDIANRGFFVLGEQMQLSDVDGDGFEELFTLQSDVGFVYFPNLDGRSFGTPVSLASPPGALERGQFFLRDVDGDGLEDILFSLDSALTVFRSNGDGTFQPAELSSIAHAINGNFIVEDMNGDGTLDLVSMQGGSDETGFNGSVTIDFGVGDPDGVLRATNGEFSELRALPGGGWERRYKDGMIVEFNAAGLQTAMVDPQGNRKEYGYGDNNQLVSMVDQVGGETVLEYGPNGNLAQITYPDGRQTLFSYDLEGNLRDVTEPTGSTVSFSYDDTGQLVSSTNQNGNTTTYSYDAAGNMSGAALPDGSSVSNLVASSLGLIDGLGGVAEQPLKYVAPEDRVTTVTDRKGEVTTIEVNAFGSVIRTVDPVGREVRITRDEANLAVRVERPSAAAPGGVRVDEIAYDARANVTEMREAVGAPSERVTRYNYEPVYNKVTRMVDPDGFEMLYDYDAFGEVTRIVDGEAGARTFVYEADGKLASRSDENGNETAFSYNASRNLGQITYADGSVTGMTYDATGNVTSIAEAQGTGIERQVQRTYDALNRVLTVEITAADGQQIDGVTSYTYLPAGNLATVTDETGLVTTMGYDGLERLVSLDDPAEGLIQRTYNEAGEVVQHINGDGEAHTYAYDAVSRLTETTDAEGFVKSFAYDPRDNISTVTDGRGGVTTFAYDTLDRMLVRTNPIGEAMTRAYDGRDNLATLTREDGAVETATYDGLGRRVQVVTPDNTLIYGYDPRSNLILAADNDSRVTFTYDERNRLVTSTTDGTVGPQPEVTLSYTYDQLDRRLAMSDSFGGTTTYAYDPEDRLTELTAPWGTVYTFGYDGEGRRTSLTSTSGRVSTYTYENDLLTRLEHAQSGVALTDLSYAYGPDAQLTSILDNLDPSKSKAIAYDDLNRLVQVAEGVPVAQGGVPIPVEDYAYDQEGNRLASHLSALYSSNAHNQLLEDDDFTYAYDAKGNRVSKTSKLDGSVETYSYDSQNRLVGYASPTVTASYAYDALDRRIGKMVDGTTATFVYNTVDAVFSKSNDVLFDFEDGKLLRRWLMADKTDEPIAYEEYTSSELPGSGTEFEVFADRNGTITHEVDVVSGSVRSQPTYDAYGLLLPSGEPTRYGFAGREFDPESGLYYNRARHYEPRSGRFVQIDPLEIAGGSFNQYTYAANNPVHWKDPTGFTKNKGGPKSISGKAEYHWLSVKGSVLAASSVNTVASGTLTVVEGILTKLMDAGLFDNSLSGQPAGSPQCTRSGNDGRSKKTQRAYIVFSRDGAEKVGITGGPARKDGVSIRALTSMRKVKLELAKLTGDIAGELIVVIIQEMAGAPGVRQDMLQFEQKVASALDGLGSPLTCHKRPKP